MSQNGPVTSLSGISPQRAKTLKAMGIETVGDLLRFYPRDYDDRCQIKTINMLNPDAVNTIRGFILFEPENVVFPSKKGGKPLVMTKARLKDETGELELIWFNQPYLKKYFKRETEYYFTGKVKQNVYRLQMESPEISVIDEASLSGGRIVPIYTTVKSIPQKAFRTLVHRALTACKNDWPADDLPGPVRLRFNLCDISTAIQHIHFPESDESFLSARKRLVFEELFFMQSALLRLKGTVSAEPGIVYPHADAAPFLGRLPYALTSAQEAVLYDITNDLKNGGRMNRLVQGDVGSGKTAIAMAAAYMTVKNGYQAAIMAPTEVLAGQHFEQFSKFLTGYETVLLTGSLPAKVRRNVYERISEGTAQIIIGTHALIQTGVTYRRLALVVTDEQHRFGVNQRLTLREKGQKPHTLIMTATPIPRTLGLILYGDMDISVINELPPGRREIKTYCVSSGYRERIHGFIRREAEQGRQAYVICPAIEESEANTVKMDVSNVLAYTKELSRALPGIVISCLHGRMKPAEKEQIMSDFKANRIQVLVSTTVIEVGVHVANATLMVIENADRFGLSQLHQLRGRVGRSDLPSYCVLVTDSKNKETQRRMKAMTETTDGFRLSELDLELRGAGDFFGTRQHGLPGFTIANLYRDMDILKEAQEAAVDITRGLIPFEPEEERRYMERISAVLAKAGGRGGYVTIKISD
jgi:ATP-dependent DNA helicase RecG